LRSLRRIFPAADFGTASMNSTKRTFLCGATLVTMYSMTASSERSEPGARTTKALGSSSPLSLSGTPMTAASAISGCPSSTASSSAGATW
jgi:hypothetical protein